MDTIGIRIKRVKLALMGGYDGKKECKHIGATDVIPLLEFAKTIGATHEAVREDPGRPGQYHADGVAKLIDAISGSVSLDSGPKTATAVAEPPEEPDDDAPVIPEPAADLEEKPDFDSEYRKSPEGNVVQREKPMASRFELMTKARISKFLADNNVEHSIAEKKSVLVDKANAFERSRKGSE